MRQQLPLLLVIIITILIGTPIAVLHAQDDAPPPGVDIVFVVDQSGSMSRGTFINLQDPRCTPVRQSDCPRTAPTDPDGLALKAVREGLSPIFNQIVVRTEGRSRTDMLQEEHSFGLVLFGGDSDPNRGIEIAVPLTRIEVERDAEGNIQSNVEKLLPTEPRQLGETAFSHAFDAVCTMLQCTVPPPPGRKRAVVLLTDGRPSLDAIGFDGNNPAPYFAELRRRHADLFNTSELWVFGLDKQDLFWSRTAPYWQQIAPDGRTTRLTDPRDIASKFRDIALTVVGEPPAPAQPCDGSSFTVDPYLATLTLLLEYPDFDSKAAFTLPNGETLTREASDLLGYSYTGMSETFILGSPPPGEWSCNIIGTSVTPQFRNIQGLFSLAKVSVGYSEGPLASTCHDFSLVVTYFDDQGNKIVELPEYPLTQTLTVTIGDRQITRNLVRDSDVRDRWKVEGMLSPSTTGGTYPLDIKVHYGDKEIFHEDDQTITIDPRLPCMTIVTPRDGGISRMHQRLSPVGSTFVIQLTQGGEPGTPTGIFRDDLSQIITGQVKGPADYVQTIAFKPIPDQPGQFSAVIDDLQTQGVYTLTTALEATTQEGEIYELSPQSITFKRVPGMLWLIVEWLKRFGALIAIIIALISAGFFVFMVTGPFPHGSLVFEERTSGALAQIREWNVVRSFSLSGQKILFGKFRTRWPTIKKGLPKEMGLRKLTVRRYTNGRNEGVTVTLLRTDKKSPLTLQFTRDKEHKSFDGKYRITYENLGASRKKP
jgi:hypothetical protein